MTVLKTLACAGLLILAVGLEGCATSSTPNYYTLIPKVTTGMTEGRAISVSIGPFELPEYLNRPQMVTRGTGAALTLHEFHRWAEPLSNVFVRTLATNVSRRLGSDAVYEYPVHGVDALNRVSGTVQRFDVNDEGLAILEVQWAILDREGQVFFMGGRSYYKATIIDADNFDAHAEALSITLEKFAVDITAALIRLARH